MITIRCIHDKNKTIHGYTVEGHASAGEPGEDIVCAAVSALAYTGLGALLNLADDCEYSVEDGSMRCFITANCSEKHKATAQIIFRTISIGFLQIQKSYKDYVRVIEEEV